MGYEMKNASTVPCLDTFFGEVIRQQRIFDKVNNMSKGDGFTSMWTLTDGDVITLQVDIVSSSWMTSQVYTFSKDDGKCLTFKEKNIHDD